jgi:hypothetical protein
MSVAAGTQSEGPEPGPVKLLFIVFSKDRPGQLRQLLSSARLCLAGPGLRITAHVLYKCTDDRTASLYRRVAEECRREESEVEWTAHFTAEDNFAEQLLAILASDGESRHSPTAAPHDADFVMFGVDDMLFYSRLDLVRVQDRVRVHDADGRFLTPLEFAILRLSVHALVAGGRAGGPRHGSTLRRASGVDHRTVWSSCLCGANLLLCLMKHPLLLHIRLWHLRRHLRVVRVRVRMSRVWHASAQRHAALLHLLRHRLLGAFRRTLRARSALVSLLIH